MTQPRCQACGTPIGVHPASAAPSPDGRSTWWLHRDLADCVPVDGRHTIIVWHGKLKRVQARDLEVMDATND